MDELLKRPIKLLLVSTWRCACGISTYSSNLVEQLEKFGVRVEIFSDTKNFTSLVRLAKDTDADVVHIQHEFGIAMPIEALLSLMGKFRTRGKPVVITTHTEDALFNVLLDGTADAIILHNDTKDMANRPTFSRFYKVPHGIPELTLSMSQAECRKKYNIPIDAFVVGTCGFMSPQRGQFIEDFIGELLPFIKKNKEVYFHIATSSHRADSDGNFAKMLRSSMSNMAQEHGFDDRFHIHAEFMDNTEFRERLCTFDVGFAHTSSDIVSNSGAAADMVSCGVPVVVNDVPHFSHIKPYVTTRKNLSEMVAAVQDIYTKGKTYQAELKAKALEAPKAIGYSKVAKQHIDIYKKALSTLRQLEQAEEQIISKNVRKLDKDNFVTVTCPNSLWQIMLLLQKLYALVEEGYRLRFVVQNDGLMETGILPFMLEGVADVQYADIGMDADPRVARLYSRSLAQNMTADVERWLKDGKSFNELFPFLTVSQLPLKLNLGEFAHNRAKGLAQGTEDLCVINVGDEDMLMRAAHILQKLVRDEGVVFKRILISGKPTTEQYARALFSKLENHTYDDTKIAIEDTRTRWALCHQAHTVITGWDDVAAYCLVNKINTVYDCDHYWQHKLVVSMGNNSRTLTERVKDKPVSEIVL